MTPSPALRIWRSRKELDIAICIDRIQNAFDIEVGRVLNSWAGPPGVLLPDKVPAVGFAADAPGFFWLAGQGGYGIQSAPRHGPRRGPALVRGEPIADDIAAEGVRSGRPFPATRELRTEGDPR